VVAVPTPGTSLSTLEKAVEAEIVALRGDTIAEADIRRARQALRAAGLRARDGTHRAALVAGMALATGATLEEVDTWPDRILAVTLDQVRSEARTLLRPESSATGLLAPRKEQL
jgi:zinc protease